MSPRTNIDDIRHLLDKLIAILQSEGEQNWVRGVIAARDLLGDADVERGYAAARSVLKTMTEGKGAFSDYYIQRSDFAEQLDANQRLDAVRDELCRLLQI
jgi:hypothetical protein